MIFVLALFEETFVWQRFEGEKKNILCNEYVHLKMWRHKNIWNI